VRGETKFRGCEVTDGCAPGGVIRLCHSHNFEYEVDPYFQFTAVGGEKPGETAKSFRFPAPLPEDQTEINTGGKAPTTLGSFIGEVADVPYTAEYYFYHSED
jgi:hypothetical protein